MRIVRRLGLAVGYAVFLVVLLEVGMRLAGLALMLPHGLALRADLASEAELRILAVGESTTFGLAVEPDEAYPKRLETLLNRGHTGRAVVFNLGVVGQTSTSILRSIGFQLRKYRPHVVLCLFGVNDLNEMLNDMSARMLLGFRVPEFVARLRVYRLASVTRDYLLYGPSAEKEGAWIFFDREQEDRMGPVRMAIYRRQLEDNYREILEIVRAHGAVPVILPYLHGDLRPLFRRLARETGALFVEIPQITSLDYFAPDRFHANAKGHRIMADAIARALEAEGLASVPARGSSAPAFAAPTATALGGATPDSAAADGAGARPLWAAREW